MDIQTLVILDSVLAGCMTMSSEESINPYCKFRRDSHRGFLDAYVKRYKNDRGWFWDALIA